MPNIRPISDLRNNANEISEFCHTSREPVFITKNGVGDMVVMSVETYERQQALISLYIVRDIVLKAKGYRYLIVESYIVFFVIKSDTVQIRRIIYGMRNYKWLL